MDTTAGLRLARTVHPGDDPPVVALHGLASSRAWWRLVAERSAYRIVSPDLRGHGESPKPDDGYGFEAVGADVVALADELGLTRFVVAGHSWGASVALWLAAAIPDRVAACVCVDGGLGDLRSRFSGGWPEAEIAMRPPDLTGIRRADLAGWAAGPLAEGSDAATVLDIILAQFEPLDPDRGQTGDTRLRPRLRLDRHLQIARELFELDSTALLSRITVPVTAILARDPAGGDWQRGRERGAAQAAEILGGRLRTVWVDGGHDIPVQRPGPVARALDEAVASAEL